MLTIKTQYYIGRTTAHLVTPILRITGYRFGKAWRGQWIVDHVAANLLADGITPDAAKF
jgi:hypothetical protein